MPQPGLLLPLSARTSLFADTSCQYWGWDDNGWSSVTDARAGAKLNYGTSHHASFFLLGSFFAWVPEVLSLGRERFRSQVRLLGLAALVGIVAGLGAIVFYVSTRIVEHYALGVVAGYYPEPHPGGEPSMSWLPVTGHPLYPWLLLVIPTVGGLLSGVLVYTLAPEAEGHGTDSAIAAYHYHQGQIRPRVPLVKIVASALTLGSGGSGGREGPIAQIGAGFGSLLGNLLHLRPAERRVLMAAGMGAGIGAIFRAPLAGTIFAAEVMYSSPEFESEVIIPAGIASVISYCVYGIYSGWEPLFTIPDLSFTNPLRLGPYLLLALFMALLAMLYTHSFYGTKRLFDRLPIHRHFRPALGAFLTGLVACVLYFIVGRNAQVLAVLAFGYSSIQNAMTQDGNVTAMILLTIALGKILTTSLTIGSGGSGGVFGPSMVIGGCGGGALGIMLHQLFPVAGPASCKFCDRRHGRILCRRSKDSVFHAHHRERNDRRLFLVAPIAVGLHAVLYSLRQAIDLFLAGGEPFAFSSPPRHLCSASFGGSAGEPVPFVPAERHRAPSGRFADNRHRTAKRSTIPRLARGG